MLQEVVSDPDLDVALRGRAAQGLVHASPGDAPDFLRDLFMRVSERAFVWLGRDERIATRGRYSSSRNS